MPLRAGSLLIAAAVATLVWAARSRGWLEQAELAAYDAGMRARPAAADTRPAVLVVELTEDEIHALGEYPLSDERLASAIDRLEGLGAAVLGLDIYRDFPVFSKKDVLEQTRGDEHLARTLLGRNNIVWAWKAQEEHVFTRPPPVLLEKEKFNQIGFADVHADPDGVLRRWLLVMPTDDQTDPALAAVRKRANIFSLDYAMARLYLAARKIKPAWTGPRQDVLQLGGTPCPPIRTGDGPYVSPVGGYEIPADYKGDRPFYVRTFGDLSEGRIPREEVAGNAVVIGVAALSQRDTMMTPQGRQEYGVELHARAVDQLIRTALRGDKPIAIWPKPWENTWLLAWALGGGVIGLLVRSPWKFALAVAAGLAALAVVFGLELRRGQWAPVVPPALAWVASAALVTSFVSYRERQDRAAVTRLFERHVDKPIFDAIWAQRDELLAGGLMKPRRAVATVLFTDLRGFSSAAEKMDPAEVMEWLNEYMTQMSAAVMNNGGVVMKYMGDAVMAAFGIPLASDDPATHARDASAAVAAALGMRRELAKLNAGWKEAGRPTTFMRVGIFTGPLVDGSLGSAQRVEYTCLGGTVNTAARLESYDKKLMDPDIAADGCRILISQSTYALVKDEFRTRAIGEVELAGISSMVAVYGVIGRAEAGSLTSAVVGGA